LPNFANSISGKNTWISWGGWKSFIIEIEGSPKTADVTRWGQFTEFKDIKKRDVPAPRGDKIGRPIGWSGFPERHPDLEEEYSHLRSRLADAKLNMKAQHAIPIVKDVTSSAPHLLV